MHPNNTAINSRSTELLTITEACAFLKIKRRTIDDWRAAIGWARTLEGVDPQRVIGWGTSLSGGHVLTLAGTGAPLTAIIAQVPHVDGLAAARGSGVRHAARLIPAALEDTWRALLHRAPRYLNSIGAPGARAIMATPDAWAGLERMAAADGVRLTDFPVTVAARIVLTIGLYSPIRHAAAVRCPALIQIVDDDALTPSDPARKAARLIPRATLKTYPGRHFDVYVEPLFTTVIADQLEFLRTVAPVARSS